MKRLFAAGTYDHLRMMDKATYLDFIVEIIRHHDEAKGFEVLPRRSVIDSAFGWMPLPLRRRLAPYYGRRVDV